MNIRIFDIEADGLLEDATKIHCLSYYDLASKTFCSVQSYRDIKALFEEEDVIWLGHNIIRYDVPMLVKYVGIIRPRFMIDTLGLSWYLYPDRKKHGLDEWGEDLGIKKPPISDWKNLSIEEYMYRCEEDVKINARLWKRMKKFLDEIYQDEENLIRFLEYIYFKLDCVREQEEIGLTLDIPRIYKNLEEWTKEQAEKYRDLESVMPQVAKKKTKKYNDAVNVEGNVFTKGDLFFQAAVDSGANIEKEIKLSKIIGWNDPNSASFVQIKNWLDSLGWVPENIKHQRDKKTNEVKLIPQIKSKWDEGELCPSVKKLFEKEPKLELLEGLFVLTHRISILEGFKEEQRDGKIYPSMKGLTNTLRLKHKVVVNLPAIYKPYGKEIRGSIIAPEGYILIGSDLANIEDRTKRHYIFKYDPDYVRTMNTPGYDAHLEIGILAGFITQDDADFYKAYDNGELDKSPENKERFGKLKGIRNKAKVTNFSATYKVGAETLARNAGITLKEARKLLRIYWERNAAILDIENDCKIREVDGTRWLQNPISKFWYSLRNDKDKFSTLNQGSAVFVFDLFIKNIRESGVKIPFQYHDEWLGCFKEEEVEDIKEITNKAIEKVNEELKLNVEIGCSIQTGNTYADTH